MSFRATPFGVLFALTLLLAPAVFPGGHTWRIKEIFSNADGTIQYIETWEANGTPGETGTANHHITSDTSDFTIPSNVAPPTSNRSLLFATQGFADLGVITPDYIIDDNFFSIVADSISYTPLHTVTFSAGQLPTDGVHALAADLSVVVNSPANYAQQEGTIDLSPPAVPGTGAMPLTVNKSGGLTDGSQLELAFDLESCPGGGEHQVIHGFGSGMPASPGAAFSVDGAACSIGGSPFAWAAVPDPSKDPSRLLWFVLVRTDGGTIEGSWGRDADGLERVGPGANGSSSQCGMTDRSVSNTCGH